MTYQPVHQWDRPFYFRFDNFLGGSWSLIENSTVYNDADYAVSPTSYAFSGFYHVTTSPDLQNYLSFDPLFPFWDNTLFYNFVFNETNVNTSDGILNTGVNNFTTTTWNSGNHDLNLDINAIYQFQPPTTSWVTLPGLLSPDSTRWLCTLPPANAKNFFAEDGITTTNYNAPPFAIFMSGNAYNLYGLKYISAKLAGGNSSGLNLNTLNAGDSIIYNYGYGICSYMGAAQPQFRTKEYDFWNPNPFYNTASQTWESMPLPGNYKFSPTNQSQLMIAPVGSTIHIAGYSKLEVTNSYYNGVYGYLGQYFTNAFAIDASGNSTGKSTGVLSPYGDFFPTEPGQVALVTMPDIDSGDQGTCMVYCVSLQLDANHDGKMDLSFNGADATSTNSPFVIWANNNYDRFKYDSEDATNYQDDLSVADISRLPQEQKTPDWMYSIQGFPAIPGTRDLEDYFRLWLPGLAATMNAMPSDYTARLILKGDAQIRIFHAVEPDGGTNYLSDEPTALNQVNNSISLYETSAKLF